MRTADRKWIVRVEPFCGGRLGRCNVFARAKFNSSQSWRDLQLFLLVLAVSFTSDRRNCTLIIVRVFVFVDDSANTHLRNRCDPKAMIGVESAVGTCELISAVDKVRRLNRSACVLFCLAQLCSSLFRRNRLGSDATTACLHLLATGPISAERQTTCTQTLREKAHEREAAKEKERLCSRSETQFFRSVSKTCVFFLSSESFAAVHVHTIHSLARSQKKSLEWTRTGSRPKLCRRLSPRKV